MPQADLPIYRGVPLCFSIIVAVLSFGDTGSFPYTVVFHLLLSACNTNWSTENLFHLSRNNRLRLICKRSTFCTRWLSQNSKWSLFPVTIWKLASLRQILEESTSKFFTLQLFISWIRLNVPLASCSASSYFSRCTTLSSLFCILLKSWKIESTTKSALLSLKIAMRSRT